MTAGARCAILSFSIVALLGAGRSRRSLAKTGQKIHLGTTCLQPSYTLVQRIDYAYVYVYKFQQTGKEWAP